MQSPLIYSRFPFNLCTNDHLQDSSTLIYHGIDLTIQFGLIDLQEIQKYERIRQMEEEEEVVDEEEMEDEEDEEIVEDYMEIIPRSPTLIPLTPPRSSLKKKNLKSKDTAFSMSRDKICSIINEHFSMISHDEVFPEIRNYAVNCVLESYGDIDITKICQILINKQHRAHLTTKIKAIFIEKYEEIKLDSLMDYFYNVLNIRQSVNLSNPQFYDKYYRIWKLQINNYQYYDQEYFFDCYINSSSMENLFLQNGFLLNFTRFKHYFAIDIMNHPYDDEQEEEDNDNDVAIQEDNISEYNVDTRVRQSYQLVPPKFVDENIPKRLRFNDNINIIKLDTRLPVDHVM